MILLLFPILASAQTTAEINQQIADKNARIDELNKEIAVYQQNIKAKQQDAVTLKNQMSILTSQISKARLNIETTETEIDRTNLEIKNKVLQINDKESAIGAEKSSMSEILQTIQQNDRENLLRVFILNNSISDYFNSAEYAKNLQDNLLSSLVSLKTQKQDMLTQKQALENKQKELTGLKDNLTLQQQELNGQITYKNNLLAKTKQSESKFNQLYTQALKEQQSISAQITALEKQARARASSEPQTLKDSVLIWPVPQNTVTTYFHDPEYPFRYLFEHPAIDIRAKQGTPIHAATEGYVLTAKDSGMGYSYIALIHANGLSTVYGHVSAIYVKTDQYVNKGDVIGLSGGMPGTPGAGSLTTGPHLHFEVRLNGIPVNALDYLP